jgi:hypothetical protein
MVQLIISRSNVVEHFFYLFTLLSVLTVGFDMFLGIIHVDSV